MGYECYVFQTILSGKLPKDLKIICIPLLNSLILENSDMEVLMLDNH